jgi:hypothetical protein
MSTVHLEPIVFTVRVFLEDGEYGEPYDAVCTLQKMGTTGYVSGCHGKLNHKVVRELSVAAARYGMDKIEWRRGVDE